MLDMLVWIVMKEFKDRLIHASGFNDKTNKFLLFPAGNIVAEKVCSREKYFSASGANDTLCIATATLKWFVTVKFRVILL